MTFTEDGEVSGDFGDDGSIEISSDYTMQDENIRFKDKSGAECPGTGVYRVKLTGYYLSLNYVSDDCGGRVKTCMGFWVREGFQDQLLELADKSSSDPSALLTRGRMYLALGKSKEARADFDAYIEHHPENAVVYINRAATRFPFDMQGVVEDCDRAIELKAGTEDLKNAYFLRGLALYELGEKEVACADFQNAIDLGFRILKEAEKAKCAEYWEKQKPLK
jgi:tetratricopeptide (TPR) repeat protein